MAGLVRFVLVEEEYLVSFGDGFCAAYVMNVDPSIREDQVRRCGTFRGALVLAQAWARHLPHRYGVGDQQGVSVEVSHVEVSHTLCRFSRHGRRAASGQVGE